MSRLRLTGFLLLLLALPAGATPRPETLELKSRAGSLGQLPRIVMDDGNAYVSAERLAALLRGTWTAKGSRAALTVGKRSAEFVRNQSRTVIAGQSLALEAPVRVGAGGWLIPEEFLGKSVRCPSCGETFNAPAAVLLMLYDLVAEEHDGGLWAIQAKVYRPYGFWSHEDPDAGEGEVDAVPPEVSRECREPARGSRPPTTAEAGNGSIEEPCRE